MKTLPYAEQVGHYWKTSTASPESWVEKSKTLIRKSGGVILSEVFGSQNGKEAYLLTFKYGETQYKIVWPVLPTRSGDYLASRRQATTLMFYDVKAKILTASVLGFDTAFFSYMMLPDGRVSSEVAVPELGIMFPKLLS